MQCNGFFKDVVDFFEDNENEARGMENGGGWGVFWEGWGWGTFCR